MVQKCIYPEVARRLPLELKMTFCKHFCIGTGHFHPCSTCLVDLDSHPSGIFGQLMRRNCWDITSMEQSKRAVALLDECLLFEVPLGSENGLKSPRKQMKTDEKR